MLKYFLMLLGYFITITSSTYIIGYINLLGMGYNFEDYVNFITTRLECWMFLVGVILLFGTLMIRRKDD